MGTRFFIVAISLFALSKNICCVSHCRHCTVVNIKIKGGYPFPFQNMNDWIGSKWIIALRLNHVWRVGPHPHPLLSFGQCESSLFFFDLFRNFFGFCAIALPFWLLLTKAQVPISYVGFYYEHFILHFRFKIDWVEFQFLCIVEYLSTEIFFVTHEY